MKNKIGVHFTLYIMYGGLFCRRDIHWSRYLQTSHVYGYIGRGLVLYLIGVEGSWDDTWDGHGPRSPPNTPNVALRIRITSLFSTHVDRRSSPVSLPTSTRWVLLKRQVAESHRWPPVCPLPRRPEPRTRQTMGRSTRREVVLVQLEPLPSFPFWTLSVIR